MARKALAYLGPTIPKIRIFRNLREPTMTADYDIGEPVDFRGRAGS
jgi:hypothetical protein